MRKEKKTWVWRRGGGWVEGGRVQNCFWVAFTFYWGQGTLLSPSPWSLRGLDVNTHTFKTWKEENLTRPAAAKGSSQHLPGTINRARRQRQRLPLPGSKTSPTNLLASAQSLLVSSVAEGVTRLSVSDLNLACC